MEPLEWIGIALVIVIALSTARLERSLERRERRSAWGDLLRCDALGRTLYVPFGTIAYVIDDPKAVRRVERLSARAFALLEAGALGVGAVALVLVAISWHVLIVPLAIVAVAGWALLIGGSVREARRIAGTLERAS